MKGISHRHIRVEAGSENRSGTTWTADDSCFGTLLRADFFRTFFELWSSLGTILELCRIGFPRWGGRVCVAIWITNSTYVVVGAA